jgi:hypothetical protein
MIRSSAWSVPRQRCGDQISHPDQFCDQWRRLTQSLHSPGKSGRPPQYRRDLGRDICEGLQKADQVLKQLWELTLAVVVG